MASVMLGTSKNNEIYNFVRVYGHGYGDVYGDDGGFGYGYGYGYSYSDGSGFGADRNCFNDDGWGTGNAYDFIGATTTRRR